MTDAIYFLLGIGCGIPLGLVVAAVVFAKNTALVFEEGFVAGVTAVRGSGHHTSTTGEPEK